MTEHNHTRRQRERHRAPGPSTCTSTCGPTSSSTGCVRAREAPYLRGWTLYTDGEPPYDVDPEGHDVAARIAADREAGVTTACLSLSAPLGIESLLRPEAQPLIDAWHRGVRELPDHFRAWASVPSEDPDVAGSAAARRGSLRRPPAAGDRPADPVRLGARRPRCCWRPSSPASRCSCTPAPSRVGVLAAGSPSGGRRSSATPRSSRRRGGAGTPSAAAACSRG